MTNESQWMGAPGWPESVPTPARPEGETPRMIVIGANSAGSILTCSLCGGIVPVLGIDSHRCPTPPARERGEALPWDTTNTVWHLVRIAGIHNGDRESKDVQRAVESVFSRFARLTRELAEANARAEDTLRRWESAQAALSAELGAARAEAARLREALGEGNFWSFCRRLLEQGRAIEQDNAAGKYPTYEHLSARLDEAARERSDEFARRALGQEGA